jgi:ATP-binding cassette, subfamily B, bacterial
VSGDQASTTGRLSAVLFGWSLLPATERGLVGAKVVSSLFIALLSIVPPLLVRGLVDSVLPERDASALARLVLLGIAVYGLLALAEVVDQWIESRITEGLGLALRERFFARIVDLPFGFFVRGRSGDLLSRMTVDVRVAQSLLRDAALAATTVTTFVATLAVMLWLSTAVTLWAMLIIVPIVLAERALSPRMTRQARRTLAAYSTMSAHTVERANPAGALVVRTLSEPGAEAATFNGPSTDAWREAIRGAVLGRCYTGVLTVSGGIGVLVVLYVGGRLAMAEQLQIGTLVALTQYAHRCYQPVAGMAGVRMRILNAAVALNRVRAVVDYPDAAAGRPRAISAGARTPASGLTVENVWFRYPTLSSRDADPPDAVPVLADGTGPWALRGVSFRVAPGRKLAVVGESGVGKTTIGYLLAGLFRPDQGRIDLDGVDHDSVPEAELRTRVGLVTQDAYLFSGSLIDNVRYGCPDATVDEAVAACRAAGIHDDIQSLPDGYRTVLGEHGQRLSGGQRQRIALARTLLRDCRVVVLDEATSHLEADRDDGIQRELMAGRADRAVIVIAHRLSSVVDADEIVVLSDGEIVERGRHAELAGAGGRYAVLFRSQQQFVG